jgi:hypothetical protein
MANSVQILDKIQRNCQQRGIAVSRPSAELLIAAGMEISYEAAVIAAPMGGIDPSASPFLGIGVANPGVIVIEKADLDMSADELRAIRIVSGHANDISIRTDSADVDTELAKLEGHSDLNGMGQ